MFYVSQSLGAVFAYDGDNHFHLIGMAIDADGVVTITKAADDLTTSMEDYAPYYSMETDEVIAKFAITPTTPMLPKALVKDVPDAVTVFHDLTTTGKKTDVTISMATLTGATLGATVASSDTDVLTVGVSGSKITFTPVGIGEAAVTLTVADSQNHYADSVFIINTTVVQRGLNFKFIADVEAEAGATAVDIPLETVEFDTVLDVVDVYSSDNEIVAVTYADDATNATVGTITCTPHETQLGEVTITIRGVDVASATSETIESFKFRVIAGA